MSKKKKIILLVSMVLVLAVAAVLNVTLLTQKKDDGGDTQQTGSFFATSRTDRQATRNYELSELNAIIALEGDEYADARKSAIEQKQKLVDVMETELLLETLLKAHGFEDVLVTIGTASDNVNVIVDKDELTREDTVRIYNIITTETTVVPDYVKIFSV